jgi:hypothetical protein
MRSARPSTAHRGSMLALALAAAPFALPAAKSPAQGAIPRVAHSGAIIVQTVDTSINPVAAEIVIPAFGLGVRLSEEGAAILLNIPDGLYLLQARRLGYRPEWRLARVRGDTARLEFILAPATDGTSGLAEARLRDFLRRSNEMQLGTFVTRAEIERGRARNLASVLSRLPGITVDRNGPGLTVVRSRRATPECHAGMLLFVDGMRPTAPRLTSDIAATPVTDRSPRGSRPERTFRAVRARDASRWSGGPSARQVAGVDPIMPLGPTSGAGAASPLDWIPLSLVGAVEIYPTIVDVPVEFRVPGADCGVVLVWTTRR